MLSFRRFVRLSLLTLAGLLTSLTPTIGAQTLSPDNLESLLENATTKEDHLKLAGHYTADAEQLREDASRHDAMTSRYKKLPPRPGAQRRHMVQHCEKLVTSLREAAEQADILAAAHREMAEDSK